MTLERTERDDIVELRLNTPESSTRSATRCWRRCKRPWTNRGE